MRRAFALQAMLIISLTLISCTDDVVLGLNNRTVDIEENNAEVISLGIIQSTLLAHLHSRLYDFLDGSDLPADAVFEGEDYFVNCDVSGSARYTFSRTAGEAHRAGDTISVAFTDCDEGKGLVHNGTLTASYSEIKGLNDRFVEIDTDTCMANLQASRAGSQRVIEVSGEEITFRNFEEMIRVFVDSVETEHLIGKNEAAIVVNRRQNLPVGAVTSVNGDQIFSVVAQETNEEFCQGYQRTLRATLDNFYSEKDDLRLTFVGTVNLLDGTEDLNSFANEIRNSSFTTFVKQGNLVEQFNMVGYTVTEALDITKGSYAYEFDGEVHSSAIFGTAELVQIAPFSGNFTVDYPHTGILFVNGRDLERIAISPNDLLLSIQVDFDGDSTGNGFADFNTLISTSWSDLLDRDFKLAD